MKRILIALCLLAAVAGCQSPNSNPRGETPYSGAGTRDNGDPVPAPTGGIR